MQRTLRIAVAGYGTAGQALAALLGADGHRLDVFERAAAPGPVGAGFLLQPSGLQVLWTMDCCRRRLRMARRCAGCMAKRRADAR